MGPASTDPTESSRSIILLVAISPLSNHPFLDPFRFTVSFFLSPLVFSFLFFLSSFLIFLCFFFLFFSFLFCILFADMRHLSNIYISPLPCPLFFSLSSLCGPNCFFYPPCFSVSYYSSSSSCLSFSFFFFRHSYSVQYLPEKSERP